MYIRELVVKNVKLLREVTISFLRDGKPRMWTVLLGENGLCKTTLLQAAALAASGVDRANQLTEITSLPDRRLQSPEVLIRADFIPRAVLTETLSSGSSAQGRISGRRGF